MQGNLDKEKREEVSAETKVEAWKNERFTHESVTRSLFGDQKIHR